MTYYRIQAAIKRVARGTTAAVHGGDADADAPAMSATVAAIARETTE
jgi:hypothetical protein